jgi:hypothetical protein
MNKGVVPDLKQGAAMESTQSTDVAEQHKGEDTDRHFVDVTLDGNLKHVLKGKHVVSVFKAELGVPPDYELDEVVDGEFRPLSDDSVIHIKGKEVFVSHVRRGASS